MCFLDFHDIVALRYFFFLKSQTFSSYDQAVTLNGDETTQDGVMVL